MTLTIIIPALMMLIGAAIYFFVVNPKLNELGRLLFAAGAFAVAFVLAGKSISF